MRSAVIGGSLIAVIVHALVSCIVDTPGDGQGVSGQQLTCIESTLEVGCRCSIAPAINMEIIDECSAASTDAPEGASVQCCEDRLVVNGKDQGVYLCACRAVRCVASEHGCVCDRNVNTMLAQGETVVADCFSFASRHPAGKCCSNGDRCSCSESACPSSYAEIPFCSGENLCVEEIGKRPVQSCTD